MHINLLIHWYRTVFQRACPAPSLPTPGAKEHSLPSTRHNQGMAFPAHAWPLIPGPGVVLDDPCGPFQPRAFHDSMSLTGLEAHTTPVGDSTLSEKPVSHGEYGVTGNGLPQFLKMSNWGYLWAVSPQISIRTGHCEMKRRVKACVLSSSTASCIGNH